MRSRYRYLALAGWAFAAIHCSGGTGPNGGGGGGGGSGLTANIEGQAWAASAISIAAQAIPGIPGGLLILGSQTVGGTTTSINISLNDIRGPGTYALGVGFGVYGGIASVGEGSGGGGNANVWETPLNGVAGTITITTLGGGRIVGTFEYTTEPGQNNSLGGTRTVTNGVFDLAFTGTIVPVPANEGSQVSAELNGVPYNAWLVDGLLQDFLGGAGVQVNTTSSENTLSLMLVDVTATGTYPFSGVAPVRFMTAGLNGGTAANCCWGNVSAGDVGSITITSITADRVQGTFSGTLQPNPGKPSAIPLVITNGTFDVGIP